MLSADELKKEMETINWDVVVEGFKEVTVKDAKKIYIESFGGSSQSVTYIKEWTSLEDGIIKHWIKMINSNGVPGRGMKQKLTRAIIVSRILSQLDA